MAGKIYKMVPVETHRGCPFTCSFCNSPDQNTLYKKEDTLIILIYIYKDLTLNLCFQRMIKPMLPLINQ